jgi:hypothetical protein
MKIRPAGAEFFHAEGQTDRHDEDESPFSKFCESASHAELLLFLN